MDINTNDNFQFELPDEFLESEIIQGCREDREGGDLSFYNLGRGGIPPSPDDVLAADSVFDQQQSSTQNSHGDNYGEAPEEIVEASGWVRNEEGNIVLVAESPSVRLLPACLETKNTSQG